jgi:nucleoside phosphorylase
MTVVSLVLAVAASACARTHTAGRSPATGLLKGHLYGVGGPAPGRRQAWPGNITVSGSGVKHDIPVTADGAYSVTLAPGRYTVVGHSPSFNDGTAPCPATTDAQIHSGTVATVDVFCLMK